MNAKTILLGLLFSFSLATVTADIVPSLMSYQGRVTDASGTLIGNASPVNRTATFRFYTDATGGTAIYAETQTVTISAGEFSVLIGNGTGVSGSPGPSSPANTPYSSLSDITNAASTTALYLGITIDDGNGATVDAEISPRQQLVSGTFALRAKVAESVASGAVSTSMIADSAVTTNQIHASAVTSAKIADGSIATADIGNNVITAAKLDTNSIGLWNTSGANVYRPNGNVGIGRSNPNHPITFADILGDKISLYGNGSNLFGFGIQTGMLQVYTSSSNSDIAFGYGSSASFHETMRIKGNGNVGIATQNPVAKLDIAGARINGTTGRNYFKDTEKSDGNGLRVGAVWGKYGIYAESGAGVLGGVGGASLQNDSLFVATSGKVGIGTTSPASTLSLREATGSVASANNGTLLLEHGNAGGASSIVFRSAANAGSDYGYIQYQDTKSLGGGGESSKLIIGIENDADDDILIMPSGNVGIKTDNTGQGIISVPGAFTSVGSRDGHNGYARIYYSNDRGFKFEAYNTSQAGLNWRGFSYDGDSNLDWYSDARLKKDVEPAEPMLDRLLQLPFRRFNWIDGANKTKEFGVIAQEVLPLFPDLVNKGDDELYTVGYTSFATIACKAIQELKQRNDEDLIALEKELSDKDAKIADLERRLAAIEEMLTAAK